MGDSLADFRARRLKGGSEFIPVSDKAKAWLVRSGKVDEAVGSEKAIRRDTISAKIFEEALVRQGFSLMEELTNRRFEPAPVSVPVQTAEEASPETQPASETISQKLGCFAVLLAPPVVAVVLLTSYCSNRSAELARQAKIEAAASAKEQAENRHKGFHCLSPWDGSQEGVVEQTKARLRDPDSFQHVETRITPANEAGMHQLIMKFRSRNGFGGMVEGRTIAKVATDGCRAYIVEIE